MLSTYFAEDTTKGRRRFREYVSDAMKGEIENPFEEVVYQSILGTQEFINWVKKKLPRKGQRELPSLKKLQHHISVEHIIDKVAKAGNVKSDDLRDPRTKHKDIRQIAMKLSPTIYKYDNIFIHSGLSAE